MEPGLLAALALATCVTAGAIDHTSYYKMVDEVGDLAAWQAKRLQIHGYVAAGSIAEVPGGHRFALVKNGKAIRVVERGPRSECLRETFEVIVRASVAHDRDGDYVEAIDLACKCASSWDTDRRRASLKFE